MKRVAVERGRFAAGDSCVDRGVELGSLQKESGRRRWRLLLGALGTHVDPGRYPVALRELATALWREPDAGRVRDGR